MNARSQDYNEADLPHYHLRKRDTKQTFALWSAQGRRSFEICGAWSRPIFAGGWKESTENDTEAFNLQTPSIFIDMRFPHSRPTHVLAARGSIARCTDEELRWLAQQHCFSGYSLPDQSPSSSSSPPTPLHFVRHHIIDWNYHPSFPRPRPNKWWIQTDNEAPESSHVGNYFFILCNNVFECLYILPLLSLSIFFIYLYQHKNSISLYHNASHILLDTAPQPWSSCAPLPVLQRVLVCPRQKQRARLF